MYRCTGIYSLHRGVRMQVFGRIVCHVQFTVYSITSFVDPFWLLLLSDLVVEWEV